MGINLFLVMFCNSTITDLFLFVFTQLILHYRIPHLNLIFHNIIYIHIRCQYFLKNIMYF
ncbi:hypothetical protein GFB63_02175 [Streptococcus thermophilus]|nr:hypothetical protein GFB63_02175 [Streptococcus thermophilus]